MIMRCLWYECPGKSGFTSSFDWRAVDFKSSPTGFGSAHDALWEIIIGIDPLLDLTWLKKNFCGLPVGYLFIYLPFFTSSPSSSATFWLACSSTSLALSWSLTQGDAGSDDGVGGNRYGLKESIQEALNFEVSWMKEKDRAPCQLNHRWKTDTQDKEHQSSPKSNNINNNIKKKGYEK